MNWELIGYPQGSTDPWAERSRTQQDKLNKEMHDRADAYLANTFAPWLQDQLAELQNATVVPTGNGKIEIRYPAIFSTPYIADTVLLEIGPLASWIPSAQHQIRSYIAEKHQQILLETPTVLTVTTAERTFWEKATIAHQIACSDKKYRHGTPVITTTLLC